VAASLSFQEGCPGNDKGYVQVSGWMLKKSKAGENTIQKNLAGDLGSAFSMKIRVRSRVGFKVILLGG